MVWICFLAKLMLLVEDEPLIALDIRTSSSEGRRPRHYGSVSRSRLSMTEHPYLSRVIISDWADDSAIAICRRLAHRNLPFIVHTGYATDALQRDGRRFQSFKSPLSGPDH